MIYYPPMDTPVLDMVTMNAVWRPIFWEPVAGTGERIMVGVLHGFQGAYGATRIVRDDVLDALYGKAATGARRLIDTGLESYRVAADVAGLEPLGVSIFGLHAGTLRETEAASIGDVLTTAALLYSSLARLDKLDDLDVEDAPQQEEVSKRFSTEVREIITRDRVDLLPYFGASGTLVHGGQKVKFGFFSARAVLHFTVISAVRQGPGVRDARARIFELHRAQTVSGVGQAALIAAVPRDDDPTLGPRQREHLRVNKAEIEQEAASMSLQWHAVTTSSEGASRVLEIAG